MSGGKCEPFYCFATQEQGAKNDLKKNVLV